MTAKKLQPDLAKKIEIYQLYASSFMVRVLIYSSVLFNLIAAYYFDLDAAHNTSNKYPQPEIKIADSQPEIKIISVVFIKLIDTECDWYFS